MTRTESEPHTRTPFHCGCITCEQWRAERIMPGMLVMPATGDPLQSMSGAVPAWPVNMWRETGWSFRMEAYGITHALVVGSIHRDDVANGGTFDCVILLCNDGVLRVTSRRWLTPLKPTLLNNDKKTFIENMKQKRV